MIEIWSIIPTSLIGDTGDDRNFVSKRMIRDYTKGFKKPLLSLVASQCCIIIYTGILTGTLFPYLQYIAISQLAS